MRTCEWRACKIATRPRAWRPRTTPISRGERTCSSELRVLRCHNGRDGGRSHQHGGVGNAHADLVGVDSMIATGRKLVVAGQPKESYLLMIMQQFKPTEMLPTPVDAPPSDVGYMPQGFDEPLCCQKLDAVERWITAGALP